MTAPQFYDTNFESIRGRLYANYESRVGRPITPSQPEAIILDSAAYEIKLIAEQNQYAASQMLLAFSSAPALDYLADLQGVERLAASAATVNLEFTNLSGHAGFVIPAGTRVAAVIGNATFQVDDDVVVPTAAATAQAKATATVTGADNNNFGPGQVTRLIDNLPLVISVTNTSVSGGGADEETDPELRERVRLASAQLSVAGPANAYAFHARRASASIIDVSVITPAPGDVEVYPLVQGGVVTPQSVLDAVEEALDPETVIPLTDTVFVLSPTPVEVNVVLNITLYDTADADATVAAATTRLAQYLFERETTLGLNVTRAQLIARTVDGALDIANATVVSPIADVVLDKTQFAKTIGITVTVTGTTDG